jgi:hypothetical protein
VLVGCLRLNIKGNRVCGDGEMVESTFKRRWVDLRGGGWVDLQEGHWDSGRLNRMLP